MEKVFTFNSFERRILVESLNHCRTEFLAQNKPIEDVNNMLIKVIKARSGFFANRNAYKIKMEDFDYRILIVALTDYRQRKKAAGENTIEISRLWVKVYHAYES